ncbi:DUF6920 family protein [Flavobacterium sp.]|uniref:DUF6920 family protein n=1 Tax=Flavobacterium sp. TaxID=239 RepID=UPI003752185B
MKKTMTTLLIIIGCILLILLIGKINLERNFNKQLSTFFTNSTNISDKKYSINQLENLPEPVQKYFNYVIKDGQPYISSVRLTHNGFFKTDLKKDFIKITGEQYFSAQKPQFIWKGITSMFTARDYFIEDKGGLIATLLNVYNVVDAKGVNFDEGELQRWLAESVWFPTNLLPSDYVNWTPIDESSAKLSFRYKTTAFDFIVRFNKIGEIIEIEGNRFMTAEKKEKWVCKMANYQERNGVKIPISDQAIWRLKDGDQVYAKFEVLKIEYNIAEKF